MRLTLASLGINRRRGRRKVLLRRVQILRRSPLNRTAAVRCEVGLEHAVDVGVRAGGGADRPAQVEAWVQDEVQIWPAKKKATAGQVMRRLRKD